MFDFDKQLLRYNKRRNYNKRLADSRRKCRELKDTLERTKSFRDMNDLMPLHKSQKLILYTNAA